MFIDLDLVAENEALQKKVDDLEKDLSKEKARSGKMEKRLKVLEEAEKVHHETKNALVDARVQISTLKAQEGQESSGTGKKRKAATTIKRTKDTNKEDDGQKATSDSKNGPALEQIMQQMQQMQQQMQQMQQQGPIRQPNNVLQGTPTTSYHMQSSPQYPFSYGVSQMPQVTMPPLNNPMSQAPHMVQYNNLQTQPQGNQMSSTIAMQTMHPHQLYNINNY